MCSDPYWAGRLGKNNDFLKGKVEETTVLHSPGKFPQNAIAPARLAFAEVSENGGELPLLLFPFLGLVKLQASAESSFVISNKFLLPDFALFKG